MLDDSAFQRPTFLAIGRLAPVRIERRGAQITAVRVGEGSWALDEEGLRHWLEVVVDGVAGVQGRFPVQELLVVLFPQPGRGVGFGMVRRGGGCSVGFLVGLESTEADLTEAWVPWHEMSHLHLPALPQRDAWLYEGLATYYQEVVAARVGVKTEPQAWRQLVLGFARGEGGPAERSLREDAESMVQNRAFMRVYWAGTAFALEADVLLRSHGSSLDAAIARAARQWRGSTRLWSSEEVCALWDGDAEVLSALRERYATQVPFPDTHALLSRLGVSSAEAGMELDDAAELSAVRRAIMQGADLPLQK